MKGVNLLNKAPTIKGITLIELTAVVVIIGILVGIAMPFYAKTVERSRIAEAISILSFIRDAQMQYWVENDAYASSLSNLGLSNLSQGKFFNFSALSGGSPAIGVDSTVGSSTRNQINPGPYGVFNINITESGKLSSDNTEVDKLFY